MLADDPDGLGDLERELRAWGRLSNPNLAEVMRIARRLVELDGPLTDVGTQTSGHVVRGRQAGSGVFTLWVHPGFVDHRRKLPHSHPAVQDGLWRTPLTGSRAATSRRRTETPVATATCPNCYVTVPLSANHCGSCDWVPGS